MKIKKCLDVTIYGYPYHSYDYYFHNKDSISDLINTLDIEEALEYIDGVFCLCITLNDNVLWITDPYGLYPIFINEENNIISHNLNSPIIKNNVYYIYVDKYFNDSGYNSNLTNSGHVLSITPWKKWQVCKPQHIYSIKDNKIVNYKYSMITKYSNPAEIVIEMITKLSKNKKILVPLSAGYDSRAIYSVLSKTTNNYDRYTYGTEKKYVDSYLPVKDNIIQKDLYFNSEDIINRNILRMNGMADIYYKLHNFKLQEEVFYDYDILFTGDIANEGIDKDLNVYSMILSTGIGHHFKTQCEKIICAPPYAQKRLIFSVKKDNINRINLIETIISKSNQELLKHKFYSGRTYTKTVSNFGYNYTFNTRKKYLERYYEEIHK